MLAQTSESRRVEPAMKHNLFVFVRVTGATPAVVGDALQDQIPEIREIFSVMGEHDLLVRIAFDRFEDVQSFVTEKIRAHPNVAQTYTFLAYELFGRNWPGFDYPDQKGA